MSFIKKQTIGTWATLLTVVLAIVSYIIYRVNIGSEGYFKNAAVPNATQYLVIALALLLVVFAAAQFNFTGVVGKVVQILCDGIRIIAPAIVIVAIITLVSARIEGFAFIYFSNEEVLQEVQTAANLSSSHGAIANIVALAVTSVVGMISAFFSLKKEA